MITLRSMISPDYIDTASPRLSSMAISPHKGVIERQCAIHNSWPDFRFDLVYDFSTYSGARFALSSKWLLALAKACRAGDVRGSDPRRWCASDDKLIGKPEHQSGILAIFAREDPPNGDPRIVMLSTDELQANVRQRTVCLIVSGVKVVS